MFEKSSWAKQVRLEGGGSIAMRGRIDVHEAVLLWVGGGGSLKLGTGVVLNDYARMLVGNGQIDLEDGAYIGPSCSLDGSGGLTIGAKTMLGPSVKIFTSKHGLAKGRPFKEQPIAFAPVNIGSNVWLGANVLVTAGVRIGDGAVVGAGAVVTKDVPPGYMALGVPAKSRPMA